MRDGVLRQARVEAAFLPGLLFLPTISIAAVVLFGGRDVIGGTLTYGEFFLFYQLLLQMVWPLEALGWILSLAQRATASASRSFAWLQGIETIPEPDRPTVAARRASLGVTFEAVRFSYGTGAEVLSGVDLALEPGEVDRDLRPDGHGKVVAAEPRAPLLRPDGRPGAARRRRPARPQARQSCVRAVADRDAASDPVLDPAARQPDRGTTRCTVGRGGRGVRGRRGGPLRRRTARRLRHADRRARRQSLRRPAAACRARAGARSRTCARSFSTTRCRPSTRRPSDTCHESPARARRPHRADRDAASLDRSRSRIGPSCSTTA